MEKWLSIDWEKIFIPDTPLAEIFLRGSVIYLLLFLLIRFTPNRQIGTLGISDLLAVVLIASAAQNALGGDYKSVTDGALLVLVIVGWSYLFNWLSYRFPRFRRFVRPPTRLLIKNGELQQQNMRREMLLEEELLTQLRLQGIKEVRDVEEARLEADGRISVVCFDAKNEPKGAPDRPIG